MTCPSDSCLVENASALGLVGFLGAGQEILAESGLSGGGREDPSPKTHVSPGTPTDRLPEWKKFYNYGRPHGAFNGNTPYET